MVNNSAPNPNLLTPESESSTNTRNRFTSASSVFPGWLKTPVCFLPSLLRSRRALVLFLQDRGRTRDRGTREGDKGGGEVTCSDGGGQQEASGRYSRRRNQSFLSSLPSPKILILEILEIYF